MLSSVLNSDQAIEISIQIMQAFVTMRKFLLQNASVFQRLDQLEIKQIQSYLYHIGASLKDLGKKPVVSKVDPWFAFSRMDSMTVLLLNQLKNVK